MHDDIKLKSNLDGMELRNEWNELDAQSDTWTHQKIREAGPDDLRKAEIATRLAVSRLKASFKQLAEKLPKNQ